MGVKLKVLHVLQSDIFNGAENVVSQIIEMFKGSEIEMAFCSMDGQVRDALKERNIEFLPMKHISVAEIKRVVKIYKPDIVHAHDYKASVLCAFSFKGPVISHLHNNSPWIKRYGLKSFAYMVTTFRYTKVLTVSHSILDEYVFGNLISKKTIMVGNPVNIAKIKEKAKQSALYTENYDVAFLGRLSPVKDPIRFIKIINELQKLLPQLKVAMIGDGELREECEKVIACLNLKDTISLLGYRENPFPILKNSKILCITSKWEGFGLGAVEAEALGCPVVSTSSGGLKQIVNDRCGKLCNNDNEFCDELFKLLTDTHYHDTKSKEAKIRSVLFDNITDYLEMLKKIYFE